jgi:protein gp37
MHSDWVAEIERACRLHGTAFFFKQWGGVRKDRTGRQFKGRTFDEMPMQAIVAGA